MPRPTAEVIRDLLSEQKLLTERGETQRRGLERQEALVEQLTRELTAVRLEVAALRQRSDDQTKQYEAWVGRAWSLVTLLVGAVLSLASGLIVTLARK